MPVEKFAVSASAWLGSHGAMAPLRTGALAIAAAAAITGGAPVMAQEVILLQKNTTVAESQPLSAGPSTGITPTQTVVAEFVTTMLSRHPALRAADAQFDAAEARARGASRRFITRPWRPNMKTPKISPNRSASRKRWTGPVNAARAPAPAAPMSTLQGRRATLSAKRCSPNCSPPWRIFRPRWS